MADSGGERRGAPGVRETMCPGFSDIGHSCRELKHASVRAGTVQCNFKLFTADFQSLPMCRGPARINYHEMS